MPFGGERSEAPAALASLLALNTQPGDELILADNSGDVDAVSGDGHAMSAITVVSARGERSPAHARNVGAENAQNDWILFLDADCRAPRDLLDRYFESRIADDVGALAGEVLPAPDGDTLVARYGAARSFLSQEAHLTHPYRPRAAAANLLVRRAAFEQVGGFYEGMRAAEDTDFTWRAQQAGWRLELRDEAAVEHRYRTTLGELRRQWRGYAAGRAWLGRRYDGFTPQPAAKRAPARLWRRLLGRPADRPGAPRVATGRRERGRYLALDALLSADELAGFALSNRPSRRALSPAEIVLVADRFPTPGDPLVEFACSLDRVRVEAASRPDLVDVEVARSLAIDYREDDGAAARAAALAALAIRHPLRSAIDLLRRRPGAPGLTALAPAVRRLERDAGARVHALGGEEARAIAQRIATLAGRPRDELPRPPRLGTPWHRYGRRP
jgi:GT2 family glycosyltransferase